MALDTNAKQDFKVIGKRLPRPDGVDKVTGRALYGADLYAPGMLSGAILRSPHAHAEILSIDTSAAEAMDGVKAVVTSADFTMPDDDSTRDTMINCMAHDKAMYHGHAVAAVAATSAAAARAALEAIKVDYKPLPHVTDVDEAMKPGAPVVLAGRQDESVAGQKDLSENVTSYAQFGHGDLEDGFSKADLVMERAFKTEATHQGYIEPHACLANMKAGGEGELWCCTQGHFNVRGLSAKMLGMKQSQLRVTASEIGGGFGGKTTVFIEPVALALSRKSGRPVKLVMTREEVLRATGPTVSTSSWVKIGMTKDGRITAGHGKVRAQGGAFPTTTGDLAAMAGFAPYNLDAVSFEAWNVLTNRPREAAYRAPGAPVGAYPVESLIDEMCAALGLDPLDVRIKNASRQGTKASYGPRFDDMGLTQMLEAAKAHPHYTAPLGPNQGRGVACGFWFNFGGDTSVSLGINFDGTVNVTEGNPDIGGSRASIGMMAAEELGIPYEQVRTIVADTNSIGHNDNTHGSRVTFSVGLATIKAARAAKQELCRRAAMLWGVEEGEVSWQDGTARREGSNDVLTLQEIAAKSTKTGGPIAGHHEVNAQGAGVSFGVHLADVEVDPETGYSSVKRYTVFQDAGKAIQPDYVEGQMQGGAVQGIGWALNEGYIYGENGAMENAGFLDYRIPVASDLPPIDPVIIEVPNPGHPYGVRGVGETAIVAPLAAVGNAVSRAAGVRMSELPMAPPKILKAVKSKG